jgi:DNA integrity scanning protein DisA with diadenylate cyclase activity
LFFKSINKIVKPLANLTRRRSEKTKLIKLEMKKDITDNDNEIQKIIREYFKDPYSNKLEHLEEMGKFPDSLAQSKLKEDKNHLIDL